MLTIWRQFIHIQLRIARRVIHYAAAPAAVGPLRSIMDNVGNGIRRGPACEVLFSASSISSAIDLVDGAGSAIMGVVTRADQFSGAVADVNALLKRHVTNLKARNLRIFLHGVNTQELVRLAIAVGIDWMDGPCVADLTRELKTLYRWNIS